jgi:hypothetical protein
MTPRKSTAKTPRTPSKRYERIKDEVYRQMYRLEASRSGAELALAIALLRAWITSDAETDMPKSHEWLIKICPICLPMIEAAQKLREVENQCIQ